MLCYLLRYSWGYCSVVEHSTAVRQVPVFSNPGAHCILTTAHLFISKQGYIIMLCYLIISRQCYIIMWCYLLPYWWGYSSLVENSTADREVLGSNPGFPDISKLLICSEVNRII